MTRRIKIGNIMSLLSLTLIFAAIITWPHSITTAQTIGLSATAIALIGCWVKNPSFK